MRSAAEDLAISLRQRRKILIEDEQSQDGVESLWHRQRLLWSTLL